VISADLKGHGAPEWLLTAYERPAPAASSGVSGAQEGAGPTSPATDRNLSVAPEARIAEAAPETAYAALSK
jgi:hypothetical protein